MFSKKIDLIKELIATNQIEEAIRELRKLLKNTFAQNEIILQSARFQDLVSKVRKNIIDYENSQVERNKIINSILDLLDNLKLEIKLDDVIIDVGQINHPSKLSIKSEVRFSVTNNSTKTIKITSLLLKINEWEEYKIPMGTLTAGPIDEYFLHANISPSKKDYELIDKHFILHSLESDGFFLKLDALEGFKYHIKIICSFKELGQLNESKSESNIFSIAYPVKSIEGLLDL